MTEPGDNIEQVVAQLITQNLALFAGLRAVIDFLMETAESDEVRKLLEQMLSDAAKNSTKEFYAMAMQTEMDEDNNDD